MLDIVMLAMTWPEDVVIVSDGPLDEKLTAVTFPDVAVVSEVLDPTLRVTVWLSSPIAWVSD